MNERMIRGSCRHAGADWLAGDQQWIAAGQRQAGEALRAGSRLRRGRRSRQQQVGSSRQAARGVARACWGIEWAVSCHGTDADPDGHAQEQERAG